MIALLDHLVLTTRNIDRCIDFYTRVLGMRLERFGQGRLALLFGQQKINIHEYGRVFEPKAEVPMTGALDLCFLVSLPLTAVLEVLSAGGVAVIGGGAGAG